MRNDRVHKIGSIPPHGIQTGEEATDNDHQCGRFNAHGDNVGIGRSMFHSKSISEVSLIVNQTGNDQHCEYDIDES